MVFEETPRQEEPADRPVRTEQPEVPLPRTKATVRRIAGLWRRPLAFWIDLTLLGTSTLALGSLLYDPFVSLGRWGRLLGLLFAVLYFGLGNSSLTGGRTPGKYLLGIRVTDEDGHAVDPARSLLRALLLVAPFLALGWELPAALEGLAMQMLVDVFAVGLGGAIVWLYLANRRNRQTLHDLVTGTYVVDAATEHAVNAPPVRPVHLAVAAGWIVLAAGWVFAAGGPFDREPLDEELVQVREAIEELEIVRSASLRRGELPSAADRSLFLKANVELAERPPDWEAAARLVAMTILEQSSMDADSDRIVVDVHYGWDLGFAWSGDSTLYSRAPESWQQDRLPSPSR